MTKSPDAFRTISEVATWLDVQAHVLRFWESKFPQVKPVKRAGGRRYYRPADMRLLGGIKTLLHDDGMTIKGVQKILREQGVVHVIGLSPPLDGEAIDASPAGGTVLAFKAKTPPETAIPAPVPKIVDRGASETPVTPDAQVPAAPITPAPAPPPAPSSPAATASGLPSFLNKPTAAPEARSGLTAQGRDSAPVDPGMPKTEPTKSDLAKSEPPEAELPETEPPYTPGPLGHLAGLAVLSPRQADEIAPLTRALRAWYDRNANAGRG
ncbi:MerR family transcriptional regulator [Antarcticimicrobium sediminis]|uniref:MerR family transcriptional regulator n=1 Tax=Antarcticimicrobium sediminis TaxID=2546227 RepID=A0A4R5EZW9_9RHOB|nr:MerR family transcriptional regulator [Antarcticimicrobium sediminis]TDE40397.1 MerR family transcriptional regulator [Antarcticimicrobium sediminis]